MANNKKLKQSDINRNTSIEVSHTIRKIKENERKYTIILVVFFMILFSIVGYNVLSIDNDVILNDVKVASNNSSYYSLSSNVVTMTSENIMSDKEGLNSLGYVIYLENNTKFDKKYKIVLETKECMCGNNNLDKSKIKYSIDGNIKTLDDDSFYEVNLKKGEKTSIIYKMWVSDDVGDSDNLHYHGQFKIKS